MAEETVEEPKKTSEETALQTNNDESDEIYFEPPDLSHRILDYINTKRGDIIFGRIVAMLENLTPAAKTFLETKAEVQKENPNLEYKKWWWLLIVRFLVVIAALGAAIYLKYTGNLDSTTSLIIVTVATVFFSFGRKNDN
jgi:hypothetical protein